MRRLLAIVLVLVLSAGTVALVLVERRHGAAAYGTLTTADPCAAAPDPYPGGGLDGALQRIALSGLNGAACQLGVSREVLVLSLSPDSTFAGAIPWDRATLEDAVRSGLLRAIDDANDRNAIPGAVAAVLEVVVNKLPIDWLLGKVDLPFLTD